MNHPEPPFMGDVLIARCLAHWHLNRHGNSWAISLVLIMFHEMEYLKGYTLHLIRMRKQHIHLISQRCRFSLMLRSNFVQMKYIICFILTKFTFTWHISNMRVIPYPVHAIHVMRQTITWDVIKLKHCPRYWPFVRGIHRSPVNSPHKCQWRGGLMFSFWSASE